MDKKISITNFQIIPGHDCSVDFAKIIKMEVRKNIYIDGYFWLFLFPLDEEKFDEERDAYEYPTKSDAINALKTLTRVCQRVCVEIPYKNQNKKIKKPQLYPSGYTISDNAGKALRQLGVLLDGGYGYNQTKSAQKKFTSFLELGVSIKDAFDFIVNEWHDEKALS